MVTRRPIPSRDAPWAIRATRWLQQIGVRPNQISIQGVVIAALAAVCLVLAGQTAGATRAALLILAAGLIPLRLLCNLLDGMLAVEGGLKSPTGELFNEFPDRVADLLIIAGAGYAAGMIAWAPELGWAAAAAALLTAYTRTLGVAAGARQHFAGPMAKPRRMHVLIVAGLLSAVETLAGWPEGRLLVAALAVIIIGCAITIIIRLRLIEADLRDAAA